MARSAERSDEIGAERRWRGAQSARSAERAPAEERSDENISINLKLQPTVTTSVTVTTPTHSPYLGPVQSTPYLISRCKRTAIVVGEEMSALLLCNGRWQPPQYLLETTVDIRARVSNVRRYAPIS